MTLHVQIAADLPSSDTVALLSETNDPQPRLLGPGHRRSSTYKIAHEAHCLWHLAWPTVLIQWGFTVCPFVTASYVGRTYGSVYLDGFTLASLTGNLSTLALLQGLFSASDTLSPQAFGACNYVEVGLLAIRGFVGSMALVVPVNILLAVFMESIFLRLGEDPAASRHATDWYRIYLFMLPWYALYGVLWKFLSAQNVMMPLVVVAVVATVVVLPLALVVLTSWWGYLGSAAAVVTFQAAQAVLLLLYVSLFQPHFPATWPPGLLQRHWRDALHWKALWRYMRLGLGGILMSCEWIYWEALTLYLGTLGVVPLSVHTVATQMIAITFTVPLGVGIALAIRIGNTLPAHNGGVRQTQHLVLGCLVFSILVFGATALVMYYARETIWTLFIQPDEEPEVWAGCEQLWPMVCAFYFNLSIFGINMGIATGLGMQWTLGVVSILFMWLWGFPASWYAAVGVMAQHSHDPDYNGMPALMAAWYWINPPYTCLNVVLWICFVGQDWRAIRDKIRIREGMVGDGIPDESSEEESQVDVGKGRLVVGAAMNGGPSSYGST